ncbi:MAG: peroxidase-related enzyme [Saprospiraceae bacterium]|nr:peroxidase-related enzyme [Saprospiraceae bacterium]
MAYINTGIEEPGIVELLFYKGKTGKALSNLAHTLLHGPSGLTSGERELIASYVSKLNNCNFCHNSHGAAASEHLQDNGHTIQCIITDTDTAPVSDKMKALLQIASKVQRSGREVQKQDILQARRAGATDEDIHDTVLIAAAFCMYNRYVDGLGTNEPEDKDEYNDVGERLARKGYKYPPLFLRKLVIWWMKRQRAKKANR